jgi:general secretion pathway protein D
MTCASNQFTFARGAFLCIAVLSAALMIGCAEQQIRRDSQQSIDSGDYEQAIRMLDDGLRLYPESTALRSGLLRARAEAVTRRISAASSFRVEGNLDEAQTELMRAKALDPQNARIDALLAELVTLRRQEQALADAQRQVDAKSPQAALRGIEQALKDNPRHAGLLALQRKIEIDQSQLQTHSARSVLAETRPISLDFRDANLRTVLDAVSRNSGINFILDRDIRPDTRVTVFLRQSRVEDALDLIVGTNQLAKKVIDARTVAVYPNTPDKQREYQEQVVRVFYLASADVKGASAFLRAMLKIREPFVDERSNMLALRDSPENIQLAARLIAIYDSGEPEVLLEVEVLEVSSSRLTELGIKYPDTIALVPLPPAGSSGLTLGNLETLNKDRVAVGVTGLLINLKRQVGDYSTLANPRIRARNKEKARIMIGDKVPVITTTTAIGGFVSDSVNYLDVGLKLEVEPTVYADDEVAIKISLEVSSLGSAVKTTSGALAYQIGTRNASTQLRLRDGETQLLAGLIGKDERSSSNRVPGLGDLPILGRLFSSDLDTSQRTELLLAITPRILRNIRRPDANESELWVGTDALPRLRLPMARAAQAASLPEGQTAIAAAAAAASLPEDVGAVPRPNLVMKWVGPSEARVGETLDLSLAVTEARALRGLTMDFAYVRERLELIEVIEGDFFRRDGAATSFSKTPDPANGIVRAGVLRNQVQPASGEGTVLTLRFKVLSVGDAAVRLDGTRPVSLDVVPARVAPLAPQAIVLRQ